MEYKKLFLIISILSFSCLSEEKIGLKNLYKKWEKLGKRDPFQFKEERIIEKEKFENIPREFESIIIEEPPNFKITGIIYSKNKSYILVEEKILKEGDEIDGFILKKVYPDYVIFEKKGKLYKLTTEAENVEEK